MARILSMEWRKSKAAGCRRTPKRPATTGLEGDGCRVGGNGRPAATQAKAHRLRACATRKPLRRTTRCGKRMARHGGQAHTVQWGVRDARSAPQSIRIKAVRAGDFIAFTRIKPHARWKGQSVLRERWFVTLW